MVLSACLTHTLVKTGSSWACQSELSWKTVKVLYMPLRNDLAHCSCGGIKAKRWRRHISQVSPCKVWATSLLVTSAVTQLRVGGLRAVTSVSHTLMLLARIHRLLSNIVLYQTSVVALSVLDTVRWQTDEKKWNDPGCQPAGIACNRG